VFYFGRGVFVCYGNHRSFGNENVFDELEYELEDGFGTVPDNKTTTRSKNHKRDFGICFVVAKFAHFHIAVFGINSTRL
jgi:hypothetical protein